MLKKSLFLLGELTDEQVAWLLRAGNEQHLAPGSVLIQSGVPLDALSMIMAGTLSVQLESRGHTSVEIAQVEEGEIVGEMSFVDSRLPSATVIALTDCIVLSIPKSLLLQRFEEDKDFAVRFYRAIAIFLSYKLRGTSMQLGFGDTAVTSEDDGDELGEELMDSVYMAGTRFKRLITEVVKKSSE